MSERVSVTLKNFLIKHSRTINHLIKKSHILLIKLSYQSHIIKLPDDLRVFFLSDSFSKAKIFQNVATDTGFYFLADFEM